MRIKNASSLRDLDLNTKSKSTLLKEGQVLFAKEFGLQQAEVNSYEQQIEELRKEIDQAGEKLEKEPTLSNFKYFRDQLSNLAKRITNEAYHLKKVGGTPQNPRYFEIITVINIEADRLYNLIITENKDHLAITAKVIGIKGMVVDLLT
ncbi:MAG: YaaR family protein [Pedobacter sp.]